MKRSSALFLVVASIGSTAILGVAFATPGSGIDAVPHVWGADLQEPLKVNADKIKFQTKAPTDVSMVTLTVAPHGTTGWHSHPGLAIISVAEGTGTLYYDDCSSKTFDAGEAFVETGDDPPTKFSNETSEPVVLTVSFITPRDASPSRDEPAPDCG